MIVGIVQHGADGNVVGHVAAGDGAVVVAHDAAGVVVAGDAGVGEGEVVDVGTVCPAEDALVFVGVATAALVDADAADGLFIAVEVAAEVAAAVVIVASDGLVVALSARGSVPVAGVGVADVIGELEVRAAVAVALEVLAVCAVDAVGQQVELAGVFDEVGLALAAIAVPGDDDDIGRGGDIGVGHGDGVIAIAVGAEGMVGRTVVVGDGELVAVGCGVRGREADGVAAAGVEHIII